MRDVKEPEIRKAEIMDVAGQLFMEKGYLKTTTQDIIERLNISRGLLYYHFKNKEDILYCLVERQTTPLLKQLKQITYNTNYLAIEKTQKFIEATMIKSESITEQMVSLQQSVDLEQNRYVTDRFSHKLVTDVTLFFEHIIVQGNEEKVFHVNHPFETAVFLMTGYVFVSNDIRESSDHENYLHAFHECLERVLQSSKPIFN
ncbi:hypothetical protein A5821_003424 [Enterococcus sp. 7F3_DIV0205]|uniref:HTH tetR-type domain-containing protein n=1 Tax=Candidatus Enterococcus palustris TaxID=1834189 RepID=A0AAQ3WDU5_9ENTE|nr:TetR/AcrR family transcriptional regulator [Enterococcus sp. 7F3_DIV0205]OTN84306.1 hypothetical protein A5821_000232 [Enterococcus sp. 7F3_DIV0205]